MQKYPETPFEKFACHFGTNYAPTEAEVAELRAILRGPDGQIRALDEEIAHRESQIDELRKRREALKDSTKNYRALLSPIRRIPEDLLQDIFLACLPGNRCPSMSSDEAPVLLTQVSSWWRQVAHLTPRLWAAIHIPFPSVPSSSSKEEINPQHLKRITHQRIEAVKIWFQRSGSYPLRVSLHERLETEGDSSITQFLTDCLIPVCCRWQDLSLTARTSSLYPIQHLNFSQMPLLNSLSLSFGEPPQWQGTSWGPIPTITWQTNGILGCQRLTSLRISADLQDIPWDAVKWEQLTTLTLESNREAGWSAQTSMVPHIKSALRRATALTSCNLYIRTPGLRKSAEPDDAPIELPFLKQLNIEERDGASPLPLLRTPMLRYVSYHRLGESYLEPSPLLQFLNSNIGIQIEEFFTDNESMSAKDLTDALWLCPALRLLHINIPPWVGRHGYHPFAKNGPLSIELLTLFAPPSAWDSGEILCPKLEDVEFLTYEPKLSEADIVKFIQRKQQSEDHQSLCKLRTIKVEFIEKSRGGEDVKADLKPYLDAGLKVDFRYHPATSTGFLSLYDGLDLEEGTDF